jgi:two-component system NtrC family sensor kinase
MGLMLAQSAGGRRVAHFLHGLIVVAILLPFGFLAAFAWATYRLTLTDAEKLVARTVDVLHENTLKVFETQELILDQVANLTASRSVEEVAAPDMISRLKALEEGRAQVASIWLIDSQGLVRASSVPWSPGLNGSDRDYFQAHLVDGVGTYVGKAYVGRATGRTSFGFSRRWPTADGSFGGVISISVSSDYFSGFFEGAAPEIEHIAAIVRTDGEVLARDPARPDPGPLSKDDPLMQALGAGNAGLIWRASRLDGVERLYGYRRIGWYPLAVTFAVPKSAILRPWFESLAIYGGIAVLFALSLVSLIVFALRAFLREESALELAVVEAQQRVTVEEQLRRTQKLEALGQLTGGVAHDFGNLLFNMLANLELLRDRPDKSRDGSRIADALAAGERAKKLIQSLLAFARRQPLAPTKLDANEIIEGMKELLRQSLGYKGRIVLEPAQGLWPVSADRTQLEMSLLNLVVNARDALSGSGKVEIATRNVRLTGEPDGLEGEFVALSVSDDGRGMSAEVLEHAFEPFFTTKGPREGTGLGLASVYGFARQCGGAAAIASALGKGTVVTIYLPRLRDNAEVAAKQAGAAA